MVVWNGMELEGKQRRMQVRPKAMRDLGCKYESEAQINERDDDMQEEMTVVHPRHLLDLEEMNEKRLKIGSEGLL